MTTLNARPEAITFDVQRSALIVVDMQNAYASKGGYLDLAGFDVSTTQPVIENIKTAVHAARAAGMLIVWFQNGWDDQYVEAGGPGSPNFHKSNALKTMRQRPELQARCWRKAAGIINWWMSWYRKPAISYCRNRATAAFSIPARQPAAQPGHSSSGLYGHCHQRLRGVDPARRLFLEYFGVVLEDATHQAGPDFAQKAALFNIETFFGWVSNVNDFCDALDPPLARIA